MTHATAQYALLGSITHHVWAWYSCPPSGLLCLKAAKSGGKSSLASTITIHNELLKRDPKIVKTLVSC